VTTTVGADEVTTRAQAGARTFPALDTLRAVAALAVLSTHAAFWSGAYTQQVWGTALARLDVGVAVFFVLSGFLLSRPWLVRHRDGLPPPATGRYLWKRALRIVPVYMVSVVAALVLLPGNQEATPATWVKTLLLANIYVDDTLPEGLTQMWSLATEVAFYLVLPALMWLALRRSRSANPVASRLGVVVGLLVLVNVLWLMDLSVRLDSGGSMIRLWLPSYLTWFSVGLVLAACEVRHAGGTGRSDRLAGVVRQLGTSPGLCWAAAGALLAIAATPIAGPADLTAPTLGAAMTKNLLYAAIAAFVILPGVFARPNGWYNRALSHPAPRHLGHISYGIFCVHLFLLELIAEWRGIELFGGRGLELFLLTLVAAVCLSELLYRAVERPFMRLRDLPPPWSRSAAARAPSVNATKS
jgi:peptidoglycan/LPS O-acetylase OafA/YrhL